MGSKVAVWLRQTRANFLVLSVLLVLIGGGAAFAYDAFDGLAFWLSMVGVVLAHASVNLFNEYSDDRTGIDAHTRRTPFSGGSKTIQDGLNSPHKVRIAAIITLLIPLAIGLYLSWRAGWLLMVFVGCGGLATVFYTTHLARWVLGELAAGICLGSFVVLGTFYAQTGTLNTMVVLLSIPPGILTALLLFLNEFPDLEADRAGGRRHLVIVLGRKKAALVYATALAIMYLLILIGVLARWFPVTALLALCTIPLALKAARTALKHGAEFEKMVPALGANVVVVLVTDFMLAVAFFAVPLFRD